MSKVEKTFRIGTVSKMTGISTHALRVWEKRYQVTPPARSKGGGRLYSGAQVARLRLIKSLLDRGHAISQIAHLSLSQLQDLDEASTAPVVPPVDAAPAPVTVAQFFSAIGELDFARADRLLGHAAVALEPRSLIQEVLLPIFDEIGSRWAAGTLSVAEEHGASAVLRNQLGALMSLFAPQDGGNGKIVAATLTGELHEFGALLAALTAAVLGFRVLYLGPNLPAAEVAAAARRSGADAVLLSVVYQNPRGQIAEVRRALPAKAALLIGGQAATQPAGVRGVTRVSSLGELEAWLAQRRALRG